MKLGKSLIITGLLFSSVLGSVNVNNITAMAAADTQSETTENKVVTVNFTLTNGAPVGDTEFTDSAQSTVKVKDSENKVSKDKIKIPYNYKIVSTEESYTIDPKDGQNVITVKVENVPLQSVEVQYLDEKGNALDAKKIESKKLPESLELKDPKKQVKKENLNDFPEGFELSGEYSGGKLNLKEVVKPATPGTNPGHSASHKGHSGYALQRVRISFIDQDGDEVGYKQLNGKDTFSSKIEAPAGYTLVNSSDATIKFDKKGNKDIKIKVTKNRPTPVMEKGIVTTNSGLYFHLYTIDGKEITNRGLSGDSKWFTDQYATINGEKMFRVATNEWVKATDVYK